MNLNDLARKITLEESKKRQVSIAQVKEILKITLTRLANDYSNLEILGLLQRYKIRK